MTDESKAVIPAKYDLNAKWDAFLDLGIRRFVYSSFAGAFAGLLLFRSPVTRWASVAFGAGVGIGSAYSECSHNFGGSPPNLTPSISDASFSKVLVRTKMPSRHSLQPNIYSGIKIELAKDFEMGVSNKRPEFLKMNPIGKVHVLETPDGPVFESNAIWLD